MTDFKQYQMVMLGDSLEYMRPGIFLAEDGGNHDGLRWVGRIENANTAMSYRFCHPIPEKRPNLRRGDPVWVRDNNNDTWIPAVFYAFNSDGKIATGFALHGRPTTWCFYCIFTSAELEADGYEAGHIDELFKRWEG